LLVSSSAFTHQVPDAGPIKDSSRCGDLSALDKGV
jgi:hypothetical protein